MTRAATNKILELVDDGVLDAKAVVKMCLVYMSEDDVADMARANEIFTCSECSSIVDADEDVCEECKGAEDDEDDEDDEDEEDEEDEDEETDTDK